MRGGRAVASMTTSSSRILPRELRRREVHHLPLRRQSRGPQRRPMPRRAPRLELSGHDPGADTSVTEYQLIASDQWSIGKRAASASRSRSRGNGRMYRCRAPSRPSAGGASFSGRRRSRARGGGDGMRAAAPPPDVDELTPSWTAPGRTAGWRPSGRGRSRRTRRGADHRGRRTPAHARALSDEITRMPASRHDHSRRDRRRHHHDAATATRRRRRHRRRRDRRAQAVRRQRCAAGRRSRPATAPGCSARSPRRAPRPTPSPSITGAGIDDVTRPAPDALDAARPSDGRRRRAVRRGGDRARRHLRLRARVGALHARRQRPRLHAMAGHREPRGGDRPAPRPRGDIPLPAAGYQLPSRSTARPTPRSWRCGWRRTPRWRGGRCSSRRPPARTAPSR